MQDHYMPTMRKYRCTRCGQETTFEVSDFEGDKFGYAGNHNLPCAKCGHSGDGWNYSGQA